MIRKLALGVLLLLILAAVFIAFRFFSSNTTFEGKSRFLYIRTAEANQVAVMKILIDSHYIKNPDSFNFLASRMEVWKKLKPGRYEIKDGMNLVDIARILRNGTQSPVNIVITKVRTKEQLAAQISRKLECDSLSLIRFLNDPDTLRQFGIDTNTVMTMVFPNTYTYLWNASPAAVFGKWHAEHEKIWNEERTKQAASKGLTPVTAYILASIVEEETNVKDEKGSMASVYLNRLNRKMRLGADPTVKFALRNFALQRIYEKHLETESPYNTYRVYGLPPGPICTPSLETLDEVLKAPETNYLFFVAKSDFSKRHVFTENYTDHRRYANEYRKALDSLILKKQAAAQGNTP
ncbi:MAG TPA: endolytic transglycosylase MltG [Flavitalea sp.]|nr:endolytic transglycosylase MltG [Flavitalea sp.]